MENVLCGPLLRYTFIDHNSATWNGSILVVSRGSEPLSLHIRSALDEEPKAFRILSEHGHTFWRYNISVPQQDDDLKVMYELKDKDLDKEPEADIYEFWVPSKEETMRILFHSCNGFSLGVKSGTFAGPVLWEDVLRIHKERPLHVMIGGGDQVYSDAVRTEGPLKEWAQDLSPRRRAKLQLTDELSKSMDEWYFNNYCKWYNTKPFSAAAASIASLQIFDDHDIIDGFGSYPEKWMHAPIFLEIGKVAWKFYMLFQHHTSPQGESNEDPSWVIGSQKGPYIKEYSRSICTTLGKRVAFYGLDCRVDRTLERVCRESTYNAMFDRLDKEVIKGQTNHLILLLGIPIAYPRLVWLESLLSTHTVTIIRWLNKIFGIAGGLFNKFDGSAELLDDLNDHWCARPHKLERNLFVQRLQRFAQEKQVRITILSGDVHLACVGRFFSKKQLGIPQNKDARYMVNIVSSAITNAPPPNAVANMLDKRNKLHKLDENTVENLMPIFYENPDGKVNKINRTTLPSRNYCIITEHAGLSTPSESSKSTTEERSLNDDSNQGDTDMIVAHSQTGGIKDSSAAAPFNGTTRRFALDVSIRAEIDPKSSEGKTQAYGFCIPTLDS